MVCTVGKKTLGHVYVLLGCILMWMIYTIIFAQIIRFDDSKRSESTSNLDLKPEMYEIDQRVSVCFKNVVPYSILLKQDTDICRKSNDLLVIIHTHPSNLKSRNLFRKEFERMKKSAAADFNLRVGMIFVLGLDQNLCISSLTQREMSSQNDILIGGFVDSFQNQTAKSITTLRWFANNCGQTKLLLKLSDVTNPSKSFESRQLNLLIRNLLKKDTVLRGSTKLPNLKFQETDFVFAGNHLYSDVQHYLHLNYLLSRSVVIRLVQAQGNDTGMVPRQEDLYITGVLANKAKIWVEHDDRFLKECQNVICAFCECWPSRLDVHSTNRNQKTEYHLFNSDTKNGTTTKMTDNGYTEWSTKRETTDITTTYSTTETTSTDDTSDPTWYTSEFTTRDTIEYETIYDISTAVPEFETTDSGNTNVKNLFTAMQFDGTTAYTVTDLNTMTEDKKISTTTSNTDTTVEPITLQSVKTFTTEINIGSRNFEKTQNRHSYSMISNETTFDNKYTETASASTTNEHFFTTILTTSPTMESTASPSGDSFTAEMVTEVRNSGKTIYPDLYTTILNQITTTSAETSAFTFNDNENNLISTEISLS